MPHSRFQFAVALFLSLTWGLTWGLLPPEAGAAAAEADEMEAIRQASAAYVKALQEGDRAKLAAAWTPGGDYVDATGRRQGAQELIEQEFGRTEKGDRSKLRLTVNSIRLVSPDAAIEDGVTEHGMELAGTSPRSRFTAYWVKRDGRWLLDSLRESVVPLPPRNSRLTDLEWLLGEFEGHTHDGTHVVVRAIVSPDGNFILREFLVTLPDGSVQSTSQRIGWDPSALGFKSWTFDADGSFGEGVWSRHGDNWIVNTTGIAATGKPKSARNIYQRINDEGFLVLSVGSMVGNETSPDMKIKLERLNGQE